MKNPLPFVDQNPNSFDLLETRAPRPTGQPTTFFSFIYSPLP